MPMVYHSRHSNVASTVTMDDGQITPKINQSEDTERKFSESSTTVMPSVEKHPVKANSDMEKGDDHSGTGQPQPGLLSPKPLFILFLWYFFSAITLFLNKYLLVMLKTDAIMLGEYLLSNSHGDMVVLYRTSFIMSTSTIF